MYCRKEMVKIFKCYLIPKKSYGTLSKGAIFFGQPCILNMQKCYLSRTEILQNVYYANMLPAK